MRQTRELGPRFFASRTLYREVLADIEVQAADDGLAGRGSKAAFSPPQHMEKVLSSPQS
jgi:hypothetical protein